MQLRPFTRRQLLERGATGAAALLGFWLWLPDLVGTVHEHGETISNLVDNPRAARSLAGWSRFVQPGGSAQRFTRIGDDGVAPGRTCVELQFDGAGADPSGGILAGHGQAIRCKPGQVLWVQASAKAVAAAHGGQLYLTLAYKTAAGQVSENPLRAQDYPALGRWYTLSGFSIVPDGAVSCYAGIWLRSPQAGSVVRASDAMIVADPATVPDYFDGDLPGCAWVGRPHASASTGRPPVPAKPAGNGLLAGWNDNAVLQSGLSVARDVSLNTEIGMTVLRVGVDVRGTAWQGQRGQPIDWTAPSGPREIEALATACHARGIKFIPAVLGAPDWMSTVPAQIAPPRPDAYGDWADLAGQIAKRLAPMLAAIEVWNEPNYVDFWYPAANVGDYAQLLVASARAIHAAAPGVPVLSGGIGGTQTGAAGNIGIGDFLDGLYAVRAQDSFDGLSFHPYPVATDTSIWDSVMRTVRGAMAKAGDRSPLWITEIGISTTGSNPYAPTVTEPQQASMDRLLYAMLKREPDVQAVCWHTSVSPARLAADDYETGYEFVERASGRRKPVFTAIHAELAGERVPQPS